MKQFDYENYLINNPLLKEEDMQEYGMQDNEYKHMDNYQMIDVLTKIHDTYNDEDLVQSQPIFSEVAKHIKIAIELIKRRTGD